MQLSKPSSITTLHDWLIEAAETERRLPAAVPRHRGSWWPEIMPEWLAYADEATKVGLDPATSEQVTRYDVLVRQILGMHVDDRMLLWRVAHAGAFRSRGPSWARLGREMGINRRTVKRRYESALVGLWYAWS